VLRLPSDPRASIYIHDEFANQLPPSDGSIYVNLQSSLQNNDLARADRWRAYLTTDKRRYFRQFSNAHGGILDAFNQLLPMEFLFMGRNAFHIGVFHKLGRLHCDDVFINYVNDVIFFWSRASNRGAYAINTEFIEALQGRCPKFSRRDHEVLQKSLEPEGVLGSLPRPAREHVYQATVLYTRTVPSLFTFFQDWKYIQICCEVLTGLLATSARPIRDSLKKCFESLFRMPEPMVVQTGHYTFKPCLVSDPSDCFQLAYWQLWLLAMRLWPFLLLRRGRKCPKSIEERFSSAHRKGFWSLTARSARRLGFDSPHLRSLSSPEPPKLPAAPRYGKLTGAVEETVWERYGTPFDDKYVLDRNSLFLPSLADPSELEGIGAGEDITTLLVRRSLFLRIFPSCKVPMQAPADDVARESGTRPHVPTGPTIHTPTPESLDVAPPHMPPASMDLDPADVVHMRQSTSRTSSPVAIQNPTHQPHLQQSSSDNNGSVFVGNIDVTHVTNPSSAPNQGFTVLVWDGGRVLRAHTAGTKEQWILDLLGFIRHRFSLWDPETLHGVSAMDLGIYPKRQIVAISHNHSIDQLRQARGMGLERI
jgi:hypothetical protein